MRKYIIVMAFFFIAFDLFAAETSIAERRMIDPEAAAGELQSEQEATPTSVQNVEDRYRKLVRVIKAMMQNNRPVIDILPPDKGKNIKRLIESRDFERAAGMVSETIRKLPRGGMSADTQPNGMRRQTATGQESSQMEPYLRNTASSEPVTLVVQSATNSRDADKVIWGTEGSMYTENYLNLPNPLRNKINAINGVLKTRYIKIRLQQQMVLRPDGTFTHEMCMPSQKNCRLKFNLDDTVKLFKVNNWSMIPMLSNDTTATAISSRDIDTYVDFVDWFISRYKNDANIGYIELLNDPRWTFWKGTKKQLLELNNKVYDRIKGKFPEIMMGTPGFEYNFDGADSTTSDMIERIEYFLDKRNGAKFDFWAFHGYPTVFMSKLAPEVYPPTKRAVRNKYADIKGILEIRKRLDENGWQNRLIIDTEHTGISPARPAFTETDDKLDAAYLVQELTIKKTLVSSGRPVLAGIITLKINAKGNEGELLWASLHPDGSLTHNVKAVGLLLTKLSEYRYSGHVSGEFDNDSLVWVERFQAGPNKELYIFFKPFKHERERQMRLNEEPLQYVLKLKRRPVATALTDIAGQTASMAPEESLMLDATNAPKFLEVIY